MSVKDELQRLYDEHGRLDAALVLGVASDENHPLHAHFEWDDGEAAQRFRLNQARQLIRSVRVTYRPPTEFETARSVRAYVSLPTAAGRVYEPIEHAVENPFKRKLLLQEAERDWKTLRRKYGHLEEFVAMVTGDLARERDTA